MTFAVGEFLKIASESAIDRDILIHDDHDDHNDTFTESHGEPHDDHDDHDDIS